MTETNPVINKVVKTGNSLAVVVPAKFAKIIGLKSGDDVQVSVNPAEGQIIYTFLSMRQLPLVR